MELNQSGIDQDKELTTREQTIDPDEELTARQLQRSSALEYDGKRDEKREKLRRRRAAAKGNITKRIKEFTEMKTSITDVSEAQTKAQEFYNAMDNFYKIHADYHGMIDDDYELQDSEEYVLTETQRIENFKRTIIDWINSFSDIIQEPLDREIEFRDSVSNVGSKVRGRRGRPASSLASSRGSRASSAMAAAAAKKATLKVQAAALNKFQALEEEELRLKQETLMLNQRQDQNKLHVQQRLKDCNWKRRLPRLTLKKRLTLGL